MKSSVRWAIGLVVVGLLASAGWRAFSNQQHKKQAMAASSTPLELPIQIAANEVLELRPLQLSLSVPVNGTVQALHSAVVKAYVAGELRGLEVREGDNVKKGQVLARIDATEATARWRQAQQQADASRGQLAIAQRNQDNNAALVQKGFISTTALATSQANLDTARANLAAAQSAADAAHKAVTDSVITSPMDGQIAQRFVQSGERVGVEAKIVEIVNTAQLEIQAQLAPADSVQVQVGQAAQLQVPGAADGLPPVQAKVVRINPSAQTGSRTVAAYLAVAPFNNDSSQRTLQLRPGLFLQGNIITGNASQLAAPLSAVRTDKPQPYLQLIRQGQVAPASVSPDRSDEMAARPVLRVVHQSVELGSQSAYQGATWVQLLKGVQAGDQILLGTAGGLREGTAVEVQPKAQPAAAPVAADAGGR